MWNYRIALTGQRWPEFKQQWLGSSGQTLLAELSSMIPAVCSHAWRRHQNLAQQSCYYNGWTTTNRRLLVAVDGQKIKRESWGTKSSRCCHPKPVKISTEQGGKVAGFSSFGHRRSSCFPAGRFGHDGRSSSFRLVPNLTGWVAGITRYGRVEVQVKRVGFRVGLQLLSLSRTCVSVSLCQTSYFTFIYFLTASFFFPHVLQ